MRALCELAPKTLNPVCLRRITSRFLTIYDKYPIPDVPSCTAYDNIINAAGRDGDYTAVRYVLNKRHRDGFFNTKNTFKFITTDFSALQDLTQTLSRLDEGFTRKSAYDALIARLSRLRRIDDALRVAEDVTRGGYGANAGTFHPILKALTRKKMMEEAWGVVELMKKNQISPDVTAYNYLLTAHGLAGDATSAAGLLGRMEGEGMKADSRTYDALVLGACMAGKVEAALVVLRRMVDDGVPTLYATHAHVIGAMLRLGYYTQAVEFVVSTGGRDMKLDTHSFGLLASRLVNIQRYDEAKLVLLEMNRRGLEMRPELADYYGSHIREQRKI